MKNTKIAVGLLTAAAMTAGMASTAMAAGTLNFGCQNYAGGSVNPLFQESSAWNAMRYGVTEGLFKFTDSMEIEPWIAESYEVSEDHKTWTIKIKDGLKFSDGCDLTASKVAESLQWDMTEGPNGQSRPNKYLEYSAQISADDETNTVTIVTETAYVNLMKNLAHPTMAIVDVADSTEPEHAIIGSGPYKIDNYTEEVGYDLSANENFREPVPYDNVKLLYMGDATAKAMALRNGQVDLVENITNVGDIQSLMDDPDYTVDIATGVRTGFSWVNFEGALGNDAVRQAVMMAIDDETICTSPLIGGLYNAGCSVLPSNLEYGYDTLVDPYAFDLEGANKILDDAGIVDTDGDGIRELDGQNIVLKYSFYDNRLLKEFSQAHHLYLDMIGIGIDENESDSETCWSELENHDYDLSNNNWTTVGTGDPTAFLSNWYSKDANYSSYSNEEYDALYEELQVEMDHEKRVEIITRMQQILIDDAAVLVDGYYKSSMIYSKNVAEAHIHTADYYWLSTEIKPAE
ncbi:MAG: ABC transporter substrate-binding protein [Clostridiales bacterium]|nr:ABC transporter substrate-binding protein [Candidatus Blautia equi]